MHDHHPTASMLSQCRTSTGNDIPSRSEGMLANVAVAREVPSPTGISAPPMRRNRNELVEYQNVVLPPASTRMRDRPRPAPVTTCPTCSKIHFDLTGFSGGVHSGSLKA